MQEDQSLSRNQLFAGKISEAAERMLHLVTDMLDINAIEEGNKGLKQEEVNFGEVIPRMVAAHQMAADRKNIAIHFFPASRYLSRPIGRR